ncbi:MAG: beta-class carbonic anhydrase [Emergencia sp.]
MIEEIIAFNQAFVSEKRYEPFVTTKFPDKKLAIVTCMDTRLTELLPAALGIKNGDAKIIKNAGGMIVHPFGSAMRSLLIAIYELGVEEVMIIGHTDCGVQHMDVEEMMEKMRKAGVEEETFHNLKYFGVDFEQWLGGFDCVETAVRESVDRMSRHPLVPDYVRIYGFVMDTVTGELAEIK